MTKRSKLPFGFDAPEDSPGFLLWQTTIAWQRRIKKVLEPFGVSHAQFVIMALALWFEKHGQVPTQVLLSQASRLDKMTVSKALKVLVTQELVERSESVYDTRAKSIVLTLHGKGMIRKLVPLIEQIDTEYFSSLSKQEERSFMHCLKLLAKAHD